MIAAAAVVVFAVAAARKTGSTASAVWGATVHTKNDTTMDKTTANADFRNIWWISRSFQLAAGVTAALYVTSFGNVD